jgi:hypothetical protein
MKPFNAHSLTQSAIEIDSDRRWSLYNRLQDLGIPCECKAYQPLRIQLETVNTAIQFWQVFHHFHSSRQDRIARLEICWQKPAQPTDLE